MKVLITGITGRVGANVARKFLQNGHDVRGFVWPGDRQAEKMQSVGAEIVEGDLANSVRLKRTRPFRPQTNGKAERFIRTLQEEWAYSRPFHSNQQRLKELPLFINYYNRRRPHGGIGGAVPVSRL